MRLAFLPVLSLLAGLSLLPLGCQEERITESKREVYIDGKKVADVSEIVRQARAGGELVQRRYILVADPSEGVLSNISLDTQGFATGASYRREGKKGKRYVELARKTPPPGEGVGEKLLVFSRGDDETLLLPDRPVVVLEVLHRLKAKPRQDVVLLDLENATAVPARIDDTGALAFADGTRVGPVVGGRVEVAAGEAPPQGHGPAPKVAPLSPADPVLPAHTHRAPFLEAQTRSVTTWCRAQALGAGPVDAARALALAARPKLDPERAGGPPSALMAVQLGGDDDAGAALVVACLRALEHPARVVSGSVGDAPTLRTWAQVHDGTHWVDVDPLDIDLQGRSAQPHRALVEGFRGPLTTGLATGISTGLSPERPAP